MGKLDGRVAIVTGGGSGIGRATSLALAHAGARVVVADLDAETARATAQQIEAAGGTAIGEQADVASEDSVRDLVAAAVGRFGGLDILHGNAACSDPAVMAADGDLTTMDTDVWDTVLAVNLRGPMLGCKYAIPHMLARGSGAIVHTSSVSGQVGDLARPAYGASKAALESLTRYVATQYGKRGIRCNAIAPGVIETPALAANVPAEQIAVYERSHLTPRLGRPEDIAAAVVFLASDDAAFVNGETLRVDGGLLAHHPTYAELRRGTDGSG